MFRDARPRSIPHRSAPQALFSFSERTLPAKLKSGRITPELTPENPLPEVSGGFSLHAWQETPEQAGRIGSRNLTRPYVRRSLARQSVGSWLWNCPRSGERGYEKNVRVFVFGGCLTASVYAWPLAHGLPAIPIPLAPDDREVSLDLQAVFDGAYDRAGYDYSVDYRRPVTPPLNKAESKWARSLLKAQAKKK